MIFRGERERVWHLGDFNLSQNQNGERRGQVKRVHAVMRTDFALQLWFDDEHFVEENVIYRCILTKM